MSLQLFAVIVTSHGTLFGPFTSRTEAEKFAAYLTAEVDPADVRRLCSPVTELLNWRDHLLDLGLVVSEP